MDACPCEALLGSLRIGESLDDLVDDAVRFFTHLVIRGILNRVWNLDVFGFRQAEGLGLYRGRARELCRGHGHSRNTLNLEPYRVVQTARSA